MNINAPYFTHKELEKKYEVENKLKRINNSIFVSKIPHFSKSKDNGTVMFLHQTPTFKPHSFRDENKIKWVMPKSFLPSSHYNK